MGNNSSDAFNELYEADNFQIKNEKHLEAQLITLPHQRIFNQNDDNKSKIGVEWKKISDILSNMKYNAKSLQIAFKELASHSGIALIKTLNDDRYYELKSLFYSKILPFIVKLILCGLPVLFPSNYKLYTLAPKSNAKIDLSRGQVAIIMACYFFGLFYDKHNKNINFNYLLNDGGWTDSITKYHCWLHYFDEVRKKVLIKSKTDNEQKNDDDDDDDDDDDNDSNDQSEKYDFKNNYFFNKQYITIYRRYLELDGLMKLFHPDNLYKNNKRLIPIKIHKGDDKGIEDCPNSQIGGKVLTCGSVQEEILFTINTECLVSMLFCRKPMLGNESIVILGTQQFFNYTGYGYSFKYNGLKDNELNINDMKQNDNDRLSTCIISIDALCQCGNKQILIKPMLREMIKSYVGFSCNNENILEHKYMNGIASGNWGCGIFGGDPQLKFMLQWISSSLVGINILNYYIRNNKRMKEIEIIINLLIENKKNTISDLWKILSDKSLCNKYENQQITVFEFIKTLFGIKHVVNHLHVPYTINMKNT